MEDIIPVMIITIFCFESSTNLRLEFDIMKDFLYNDPYDLESEKRMIINLSESYNFIVRDFNY